MAKSRPALSITLPLNSNAVFKEKLKTKYGIESSNVDKVLQKIKDTETIMKYMPDTYIYIKFMKNLKNK